MTADDARQAEWTFALRQRIEREPGGSVFVARSDEPRGWVVSLTNHRVDGDLTDALKRVWRFAMELVQLHPSMSRCALVGWWRNDAGGLFVDAGLLVGRGERAASVGRAFRQHSIALVRDSEVRIVALKPARARSLPRATD
ncbi:MAG: hypothetical protein IT432_00805 [Phycisphaerales bacterium]|nr:hypothetical protein [Phycisphaerales bacterium]